MVGLLKKDDELERVWMEAVVTYFKIIF